MLKFLKRFSDSLIISFSGVDGAGKTTVIESFKRKLKENFGKDVVVLRHRPSILPHLSYFKYGPKKAKEKLKNSHPREGKNSSRLSSFLRFSYYYLDYLLGHIYLAILRLRGKTILFDRYYFDFIVDSRRSNIVINSRMAEFLFKFVPKPHLNVFLFAPVGVILNRKKELPADEISMLTDKYLKLFDRLNRKYKQRFISIKNIKLNETLMKVEEEYRRILNR